jgi:hypothetical protein
MLGRIAGFGPEGLRVLTRLDPRAQPFLFDHRIDDTAVLPGVMGLEAFAEAASLPFPELRVAAIEDVAFLAAFKFFRDEPRELEIVARFEPAADGGVVAHCRLLGRRELRTREREQVTTHFRARVRLEPGEAPAQAAPAPAAGAGVGADDLYRVYFHGPAYRVLARAWRSGGDAVGLLAGDLPENHRPAGRELCLEPRLIELCFQTAGVYEIGTSGRMGLPQRIERLWVGGGPAAVGPLCAVVTPSGDGRFDARVVDSVGSVRVALEGYGTVALPAEVAEELRAPLRAAMA